MQQNDRSVLDKICRDVDAMDAAWLGRIQSRSLETFSALAHFVACWRDFERHGDSVRREVEGAAERAQLVLNRIEMRVA